MSRFNTAYNLIGHTVLYLTVGGQLEDFIVDDVKFGGEVQESLEESLSKRLEPLWDHVAVGVWKKSKTAFASETSKENTLANDLSVQ